MPDASAFTKTTPSSFVETMGSPTLGASPFQIPRSTSSARMPSTSRSPMRLLMRMPTSISTTMQGVPRELSVCDSVAFMTVAAG